VGEKPVFSKGQTWFGFSWVLSYENDTEIDIKKLQIYTFRSFTNLTVIK